MPAGGNGHSGARTNGARDFHDQVRTLDRELVEDTLVPFLATSLDL